MIAEAGMVSTHAHTICLAMPHRTANMRRTEPTPTMAPVMVWVVLTGTPSDDARKSDTAPAVSAAKPPTGCNRVIFEPIVRMMRHPPESVPAEMAM